MIVLCAIFSAVYFAAGAKIIHIASVAAAMVVVGIGAIVFAPWRVERLMAFLDPFSHSEDAGYQVVQSLYAIGSGGIFGRRICEGAAKAILSAVSVFGFYFLGRRRRVRADRHAGGRDRFRIAPMARDRGRVERT